MKVWSSFLLLALSACGDRASMETRSDTSAKAASPPPSDEPNVPASASLPCGRAGLADCPLQAWMKANLQAYLKAGDSGRLAAALDALAAREPRGFAGWSASAKAAAAAARSGDMSRVRVECKGCHDALRARFRAKLRLTRLFD